MRCFDILQVNKDDMDRECSTHASKKKFIQIFGGKARMKETTRTT
jgi:hypothetical protein